jgi:hypothetical protein
MLRVLLVMVEQTCNARLGRESRFGQGLMIRQRLGRRAQTSPAPSRTTKRTIQAYLDQTSRIGSQRSPTPSFQYASMYPATGVCASSHQIPLTVRLASLYAYST